jgi:phosphate uptake regulator
METGKFQQVGGGTYTVSIPVSWANEHDIEAGTTAYLYTHRDGSLVVRWNEKDDSELATTDIGLDDTGPEVAERMLGAACSAGFKRRQLRSSEGATSAQRRAADARTRGLTGVGITDGSTHHVTVRGILDASDVSIRRSTVQ